MGNSWTIKKKDLENSNIYTNEYDAVNGKNKKILIGIIGEIMAKN